MDANKSISHDMNSSPYLFKLDTNAITIATILERIDENAPIIILKPRPLIVLVNMSRPIQSVPNRCSNDGACVLEAKFVIIVDESMAKLLMNININNKDVNPMMANVFCLKFIELNGFKLKLVIIITP